MKLIDFDYRADRARSVHEQRKPSTTTPQPNINPAFAFTRPGYHVRVVPDGHPLESHIGHLVREMYESRGLIGVGSGAPRRSGQITLAACCGDHTFGTVTIGTDTPQGLLADTLYRRQIDEIRAEGGRVCEVTRLAMDSDFETDSKQLAQDALSAMFNLVFIIAHKVHGLTDLFCEVHPRHVPFYRRMLGYRVAGPELTCPRVQAPAVLLHLDLRFADDQVNRHAGNPLSRERNLYRRWIHPTLHDSVLQELLAPQS